MVANEQVSQALDRILDPVQKSLTRESARAIVKLRLDKATQRLLDDYADRHHESQLSAEELSHYDALVNAISLISVLQAKARKFLKSRKAS